MFNNNLHNSLAQFPDNLVISTNCFKMTKATCVSSVHAHKCFTLTYQVHLLFISDFRLYAIIQTSSDRKPFNNLVLMHSAQPPYTQTCPYGNVQMTAKRKSVSSQSAQNVTYLSVHKSIIVSSGIWGIHTNVFFLLLLCFLST